VSEIKGEDVDFKIIREDWNIYELSDKATLRIRVILAKVIKTGQYKPDGEPIYGLATTNYVTVKTPSELMGPPTVPSPKPEQIALSDMVEVDFEPKIENWNEYLLEDNTKLRIKLAVTKVRRSNFYDTMGYPIYHVDSSNLVSVSVPKNLKRKRPAPKPPTTPIA